MGVRVSAGNLHEAAAPSLVLAWSGLQGVNSLYHSPLPPAAPHVQTPHTCTCAPTPHTPCAARRCCRAATSRLQPPPLRPEAATHTSMRASARGAAGTGGGGAAQGWVSSAFRSEGLRSWLHSCTLGASWAGRPARCCCSAWPPWVERPARAPPAAAAAAVQAGADGPLKLRGHAPCQGACVAPPQAQWHLRGTHTHAHVCTFTHTHMHTYAHSHTHTCTRMHIHTHAHARPHVQARTAPVRPCSKHRGPAWPRPCPAACAQEPKEERREREAEVAQQLSYIQQQHAAGAGGRAFKGVRGQGKGGGACLRDLSPRIELWPSVSCLV